MILRIRALLLPALIALSLGIVGLSMGPRGARASDLCDDKEGWGESHFDQSGTTVTDLQEIHQPAPHGTWRIDGGQNGGVSVSDWDKDEILICAKVTAWARDKQHAQRVLDAIHVETDGGTLRAEGPTQSQSARWAVTFRIFAPREIDLSVETVNGGVSIDGVHGHMSLVSLNGPLQVADAGGDVRGHTTNGPLSVSLSGSRWSGAGLDLETVNGPVSVDIPERYSAELTAGTDNGPINIGFPVTVQGRNRHHIEATLGSGGAPIRVVTVNGPVVLQHGEGD